MSRYAFILVLLIADVLTVLCQIPQDFPLITRTDLPDARLSDQRIFTGKSLFGYIDGGAELYLEYGFRKVVIGEISYHGDTYKTEVYEMNGPEEAFGIFSVSKYRCLSRPALANFSCQTRYQLQFCKGPYYISIINKAGNVTDSSTMLQIGKILAVKINKPDPDLSGYIPDIPGEILKTNCFLAKGRLGIVNGSPDLEGFFSGINGYTAVICSGYDRNRLSVKFDNHESFNEFMRLHQWADITLSGSDKMLATGETLRLISVNHLLISLQK